MNVKLYEWSGSRSVAFEAENDFERLALKWLASEPYGVIRAFCGVNFGASKLEVFVKSKDEILAHIEQDAKAKEAAAKRNKILEDAYQKAREEGV